MISLNFSTSVTNKTFVIVDQNNRFRTCSYQANHFLHVESFIETRPKEADG